MVATSTLNDQIINQKYKIQKLIGVGGLGRVYKATDIKREKPVAIKFLNEGLVSNQAVLGTFHRELLLTSKLHHKNIVGYKDSHFNPPHCYIVSDYVDGWNGSQFSSRVGQVPPLVALAICVDLLQGVDYLHLHDIVHSDISIANVMIGRNGRVFLTDFGFSVDPSVESYMEQTFGTPGFYSPEHITRAKIIPSSDLYCVALVLWSLITGETPLSFTKNPKKIKEAMKNISFHKIKIADRTVRNALIKVLKKALCYHSFFRYKSAKHMSYDCYRIINRVGLSYPRAGILQFLIDQKLTTQKFALPQQSIYLE
ncbi:MAG: serine/threonine-protein kinase [Proteobacteria bacterium]|nr:serine/threonine-protein kinase [Pseudomonadota bacterium]